MIGAWLAAIGATLAAVVLERDWTRVTAAMIYLAAVAAAHLATLARFSGTVEWDSAAAWLSVAPTLSPCRRRSASRRPTPRASSRRR